MVIRLLCHHEIQCTQVFVSRGSDHGSGVCRLRRFYRSVADVTIKFLGWMLHLVNVEKFVDGAAITFGAFFLGLAPILLYSYFAAYLFAWLYNSFTQTPD